MIWWLDLAGALLFGALFAWMYNRLVADRNLVAQALADIDVQLKRRADLVPQLVEAVKAHAAYERATLKAVADLRARAITLQGADAQRFALEQQLGGALQRVVLLQENHPQLKADANFRQLTEQLVQVEDHLQYARRFYNGAVQQYLTRLQQFPHVIVARLFSFKPAVFFETDERRPVEVSL